MGLSDLNNICLIYLSILIYFDAYVIMIIDAKILYNCLQYRLRRTLITSDYFVFAKSVIAKSIHNILIYMALWDIASEGNPKILKNTQIIETFGLRPATTLLEDQSVAQKYDYRNKPRQEVGE